MRKLQVQRLTQRAKNKIIVWTKRMSQVAIAAKLNCSVDTVRKWQKRLIGGVQYRRPITDEVRSRVIDLHKQGLSATPIALRVGIGARSVLKILREAGIEIKARRPLSPEKRAAIDADIRGRKDFLCKIARKYGVGTETVRRRKKQILGSAPLKSTWPPLQTKFSQKDAGEYVPTPEEVFLALVRKCIDLAADKFLLQGRDRADVIIAKQCLKNNPTPILDRFEAGLREAVAAWRLAGDQVH